MLTQVQQDDPSMEAWISIVSAYRAVHVLLNQQLVRSKLTFPQYRMMRVLGKFGAMPMNKIGEHMLVTPANITGLVDRLERRGYIERVEKSTDRRIVRIKLTRKGKILYQRTSIQNRKLVNRIMRVLTNDELLNLAKLLEKIKKAALEKGSYPK